MPMPSKRFEMSSSDVSMSRYGEADEIGESEYSQVVVEEVHTWMTQTSVMDAAEYVNPEYRVEMSPEK